MLPDSTFVQTNTLVLNTEEISSSLKKSGKYKKDEIEIKPWSSIVDKEDDLMLAIESKGHSQQFLGIVNFLFQREGYCLNIYTNLDKYYGFYLNDKRNKQGLYEFHPKIKNNFIIKEYYYGLWKDDLIHGRGINLWLKLKENEKEFSSFDLSSFQAFIGNSEEGKFVKGVILNKENDNYFLYYGNVIYDNNTIKRNGDKCFYYSSKLEILYFGNFNKGEFISGYVCKFNDDGNIKSLTKFNKNETNENKKFIDEENLEINEVSSIKKTLIDFRNVIMSQDYFGILYEEFEKIIKFRDENMKGMDDLISEKYVEIMKSFSGFNKITVYKDIETYIKI